MSQIQEPKKPRTLELPLSKKGAFFEINTGCYGGQDSKTFKLAENTARKRILEYLKINKPELVDKFLKIVALREKLETKGSGKNLFANNLEKLCEKIKLNSENKSPVFVVAMEQASLEKGEENYLIIEQLKAIGVATIGITAAEFLEKYRSGHFELEEIFMYDDFMPEELASLSDPEAENIFQQVASLYPREIENKTGRKFIKTLNLNHVDFTLLNPPLDKSQINKDLDFENYILKLEGTSGGAGVKKFGEQSTANTYTWQDIKELLEKEKATGKNIFTLELKADGPITLQPLKLIINPDGSVSCVYNKKLIEYRVDGRIGYYYDPKTKSLEKITAYGRFNYPGMKNNISQGAGVIEMIIADDKEYLKANKNIYKELLGMGHEINEMYHNFFHEELNKLGFNNNGKPIPFATIPYLLSEKTITEIDRTAMHIAENIAAERSEDKKDMPFIFALDFFANPNPNAF